MTPLVELVDITKTFVDAGSGLEHPILDGISFTMNAGESVAITGPSGCGKSTLLNLLGTLDQPTRGAYRYEGKDVLGMSSLELSQFRAQKIGFIFQLHHLLPQCSVLENTLLPVLALQGVDQAEAKERALNLLKRVGLTHRIQAKPASLSGGERQRVAFVRALVNSPRLILADEPTGALDEKNAEALTDLIVNLVDELGVALVLVTHHPAQAQRMQRQYRLSEGLLARREA